MKVVLFTDTFPPEINGVATSTKLLSEVLRKNNHDVIVVTTNPFTNDFTYDRKEGIIRIPGLRLKSIYGYRLANPLMVNYYVKLEKILKAFKPDVVHIQTEFGVSIFGHRYSMKYHIPIIYTYHTMYEEYVSYITGEHFNRASRAFVRWYSKKMVDSCLEFIAPSIKTKDYMRSIGISCYINVVPTGIDFSSLVKKENDYEKSIKFKKKLGINENSKVFLVLGRIAKEKSIDVIINGFSKFTHQHPEIDTVLVIVGGGPAVKELKELVNKEKIRNKVKFIGPVAQNEIKNYYHIADLFVSASLSETQGLTYMEAIASSTIPLVRFDNNLLDVIVDNETGFYFHDANDFSSIACKIFRLSEDKLEEMRKKGKEYIKTYDIDKFYERIIKVYERAIRKNW